MLFNTYEFIFIFLIPVVILYSFIPVKYKIKYLIFFSIVFYAQWDLIHLFILCSSIIFNYFLFAKGIQVENISKKIFLILGISANIVILGYFKYSGFLNLTEENIVLPLAISFFTFQQIAYLVDIYRKKIEIESFERYSFFVLFFPQLVAGPIMHYKDILSQIDLKKHIDFSIEYIKAGLILFSIGLFKKVVIADSLTLYLNSNSLDKWMELFAYSFMIYFDFSGYADMAIGLALMFGIKLHINFLSPYKSRNLIEFWRKWHITLSKFLKDHLYIPLGGNKYGLKIQMFSLMTTMVLGGIWHGAGWNFLLWGAMHGLGLVFLHLIKSIFNIKFIFPKYLSIIFTFLFVSLLWVFFRMDFSQSIIFFKSLLEFNFSNTTIYQVSTWLIISCFFIVWFLPNSMQLIDLEKEDFGLKKWYIFFSALIMFISLKFMASTPSLSFVYFNF